MSHTIENVVGALNEKLAELRLEFTGEPLEHDPETEQLKIKAVSGRVELVIIHRDSGVWWASVSIDEGEPKNLTGKTTLPMLMNGLLSHLPSRLAPQDDAGNSEQTGKDAA